VNVALGFKHLCDARAQWPHVFGEACVRRRFPNRTPAIAGYPHSGVFTERANHRYGERTFGLIDDIVSIEEAVQSIEREGPT
jgi:hypothetical protein